MANIRLRPLGWPFMVALAGLMGPAACGGGDGGALSGIDSCTLGEQTPLGTIMVCEEASGLDATSVSQFQMGCMGPPSGADAGLTINVHFEHAPCSHEGALGGCRVRSRGETVTGWYYNIGSTNTFTSRDIESLCNSTGATFVSP